MLADGRPEAYLTFAEDYYEVSLDLEPIRHVYALMPLTEYVVTSLNRQRRLSISPKASPRSVTRGPEPR